MRARVSREVRDCILMNAGSRYLERFKARRAVLRRCGYTSEEALNQTMEEFGFPKGRVPRGWSAERIKVGKLRVLPQVQEKVEEAIPEEVSRITLGKEEFGGRSVPPRKVVQWVSENIVLMDVSPKDAPSPGAWALLRWVRSREQNECDFWKAVYPKILPSKTRMFEEGADGKGRFTESEERISSVLEEMKG